MVLEILLVWIIGIPALAICGAMALARRRERLDRDQHSARRSPAAGLMTVTEPGSSSRLRGARRRLRVVP